MIEFNPGDASHFQNETILPLFEAMRSQGPLHYCETSNYGPYWSVLNYPEIMAIDKNHAQFSSDAGLGGIIIDDAIFKDEDAGFSYRILSVWIRLNTDLNEPSTKLLVNLRSLISESL